MRPFNLRPLYTLFVAVIVSVIMSSFAFAQAPQKFKVLYVITSNDGFHKDGNVTLHNIPTVIHFSDRKGAETGKLSLADFVSHLNEYAKTQGGKPQTAALSIYNDTGAHNVILFLKDIKIDQNNLLMTGKVLQGTLPDKFNMSTLFFVMLEPESQQQSQAAQAETKS